MKLYILQEKYERRSVLKMARQYYLDRYFGVSIIRIYISNMYIVLYMLKARTAEAEKQPLLIARTHAWEERVTYAVTSRNSRRGVARGVLCESASHFL
jgi:hypothetical protein